MVCGIGASGFQHFPAKPEVLLSYARVPLMRGYGVKFMEHRRPLLQLLRFCKKAKGH